MLAEMLQQQSSSRWQQQQMVLAAVTGCQAALTRTT
jgi:hypothetical protein